MRPPDFTEHSPQEKIAMAQNHLLLHQILLICACASNLLLYSGINTTEQSLLK